MYFTYKTNTGPPHSEQTRPHCGLWAILHGVYWWQASFNAQKRSAGPGLRKELG